MEQLTFDQWREKHDMPLRSIYQDYKDEVKPANTAVTDAEHGYVSYPTFVVNMFLETIHAPEGLKKVLDYLLVEPDEPEEIMQV